MNTSNKITAEKNEIKQLIALGNLSEAIKRLLGFTAEFISALDNDVIAISRSFNSLEEEERKGKVTSESAEQRKNVITDRLLTLLDEAALQSAGGEQETQALIGDSRHLIELAEEIRSREVPVDLVLEARDLEKAYRSSGFRLQLEHLELRLGEITGLIGENATGKSTLCRLLVGDLKHDNGWLRYPKFQEGKGLNWLRVKRQIAYIPQEIPKWFGSLRDNLRYEAAVRGLKAEANAPAVDYIVHRLGLARHLDKSWAQLSGGYKLRFSLARALVWKPQLLVLDEPLANLDIRTQIVVLNDLRNLVKSLRYPLSVLISSQELHEIEAVADHLLFMREGKLENIDNLTDYGDNRKYNTFEFNCALSYRELEERLKDFPHQKLWYNGMTYFIVAKLDVSGFALLEHLARQEVAVLYYRDISRSIKTKFYEKYL